MAEQTGKKLFHQTKGILLLFAAIPVILAIKYFFNDHFELGVEAPLLLALGSIAQGKKESYLMIGISSMIRL